MAVNQIKNLFLCVILSALFSSIIVVFNVTTCPNSGAVNHFGAVNKHHGKRMVSDLKTQDMKNYQDTSRSWDSNADDDDDNVDDGGDDYPQESMEDENYANAMANVVTNLKHIKPDAKHTKQNIKGFDDILNEQDLNNTEGIDVEQAIKNYFVRQRHNLTQEKSPDSFVIVTTVDFKFHMLFDNWLRSIKKLGMNYNVMLICEDSGAYKYYTKRQNEHFKVLNTLDFQMMGKLQRKKGSYQQLIKRRTLYVRDLLFHGIDVLLVDIDAVWLKDPLEIVRQSYTTYDLWVAQRHSPGVPCPCFLYMKSVPPVMKLAGSWMHRLADHSAKTHRAFENDQFALKHVMKWRPELRVFSLDKVRFPTGKEFFDPEWNQLNLDHVYIAHGNHLGRKEGKIDKFKEFGLWLL